MPVQRSRSLTSDFTRMWLLRYRAGPANAPAYESLWKAGVPNWALGPIKPLWAPRPDQYGQFDSAGKLVGERGLPTLTVMAKYPADAASLLLELGRAGCDNDVQIHIGLCQDPRDFARGWEKIVCIDGAGMTDYKTTDLGALGPGERVEVIENVTFSGEDLYEIMRITLAEQAAASINEAVVDVQICDRANCGTCGIPSTGCSVVFAIVKSSAGSPGLPSRVLATSDGGGTWYATDISSLGPTVDPDALDCVGLNVVVVSKASVSLHYAPAAAILAGTETWTEVTTGFVAAHGPTCIFSADGQHTWIGGAGGYIYFTSDPTGGVTVQSAGAQTVQDIAAITGLDALNLLAVGASNAVLVTDNGGDTWESVTGPAVGVNLTCCVMKSADVWFVGTAAGKLYYTLDAGVTWFEKTFPGSGAGTVNDIVFSSNTVGYLAHTTATPLGRILRTVDGGFSWYVAPENNTAIPANHGVNRLAACADSVNVVYGGGLGTTGTDGFLVKGA